MTFHFSTFSPFCLLFVLQTPLANMHEQHIISSLSRMSLWKRICLGKINLSKTQCENIFL